MDNYQDRLLIDYLPNVLKEVREFQALTFAEQPEIFGAFEGIDNALQNEFVVTATEYGIKRWEKILSIIPNPAAESLEFRRARILLRLQTFLPFTERWLKGKLDELFGESNVTFSIDYNRYKINASINQVDMNLMNEVKLLFKKVVPANMGWAFEIISVMLECVLFVGLNVTPRTITRHVFKLPQRDTILYVGLEVNPRTETRVVFNLIPEQYPFITPVYVGVLGGVKTHIKFEME